MARIRTIKPEFWMNEDLASLSPECRLLAIGLLNHSDDEGYFRANEMLIRAAVFPFTESSVSIHDMLISLEKVGYLRLAAGSDGKSYGLVRNFEKHQKINRPTPSKIKDLVDFTKQSMIPHCILTEGSLPERKGKERKGKEQGGPERETSFTSDDLVFAEYVYQQILPVAPHTKIPNLEKWAATVRLMRERDGLELTEIRRVFDFANQDSFWRPNILSVDTLRKQFSKLHAKMANGVAYGVNQNHPRKLTRDEEIERASAEYLRSMGIQPVKGNPDGRVLEGTYEVETGTRPTGK